MARLSRLLLVVVLFLPVVICRKEYYKRLNVPETATTNEIKKAFRRLAKEKHPDRNPNDPEAEEQFKLLGEAYEVLIDPKRREIYDKHGEEGLRSHARGEHTFNPFESFFGFGFDERSPQESRGDDVVLDLWVTLEELYVGNFVEITRSKLEKKNAPGTRKCRCRREMRGTMVGHGQFQMHQVEVCDDCPNVSYHPKELHLEVEIETGMRDGQIYPFVGEGESDADGDPGDLKFRIRQQKHPRFTRRGDDLYTNLTLTLIESLVGFHLSLTHLDNHQVILKNEGVTPPGTILRKPGEGMPNYENPRVRGSLYVTFDVAYPSDRRLSQDERHKLLDLFPDAHGSGRSLDSEPLEALIYNGLDPFSHAHRPKVTV